MKKEKIKNMSFRKDSLTDQVYHALRDSILDISVKPGERIKLENIQEKYGISRAPVREALNRLINHGLVRVKPRVGYYVVDFTIDQIRELYDIRKLFEMYALPRSLEKIEEGELESLRQETMRLLNEEIPEDELRTRFDRTDQRLHQDLVMGNANNQYLEQFSGQIFDLIDMTKHLIERIDEALQEHLVIFDALFEKNCAEVKRLLKKHIDNHLSSLAAQGFTQASEMFD